MLEGVERLVNLAGAGSCALTGQTFENIQEAVQQGDLNPLTHSDGHFAAVSRDGKTVRLARTLGMPLRYFVAKMYHGP